MIKVQRISDCGNFSHMGHLSHEHTPPRLRGRWGRGRKKESKNQASGRTFVQYLLVMTGLLLYELTAVVVASSGFVQDQGRQHPSMDGGGPGGPLLAKELFTVDGCLKGAIPGELTILQWMNGPHLWVHGNTNGYKIKRGQEARSGGRVDWVLKELEWVEKNMLRIHCMQYENIKIILYLALKTRKRRAKTKTNKTSCPKESQS